MIPVDKKILSANGNVTDSNSPSDLIREHFFAKYDCFPQYNRFESNLIITYFSVCLGVIYRQWEVDGQRIPIEEMIPLATRLILHGLDGAGLAGRNETNPVSLLLRPPLRYPRMISFTAGTLMCPDSGFLMLIIGVVITASTSDRSKARSASIISQLISFRPLQ